MIDKKIIYKYGWVITCLFFFMCSSNIAHANITDLGPKVGDEIPSDLSTVYGSAPKSTFKDYTGSKGLIILFVRSTDWCPYCQSQLVDWNEYYEKFKTMGYKVVAISYDTPNTIENFMRSRKILYPMISDPQSQIINKFGILNTNIDEQSLFYGIPHPYIYVVSSSGVILKRFVEADYKKRPSVEGIYKSLLD